MPTIALNVGVEQDITQNVVYAMPPRLVFLQAQAAVEGSMDNSTWTAIANSTTGVQVGTLYLRCTTGNTKVIILSA